MCICPSLRACARAVPDTAAERRHDRRTRGVLLALHRLHVERAGIMSTFRGTGDPSTYVISITPFAKDSSFDETGIRHHLRRLRAAGIGVYVGGGGSGEGFALSADEHKRLLDIAVDELKGKVPVRAMGIEPRLASQMVEYVGVAKSAGVDAAQIYCLDQGHGHQPSRDEIRTYFTDILDAVDIPSIISTHQSVGYLIPIELLNELVDR